MKNILLLTTGGTISCVPTENGLVPTVAGKRLLEGIIGPCDRFRITPINLMNLDSADMMPIAWGRIAQAIYDALPKYDGIVITHGTDTMAYAAAMVSFMVQSPGKPIIFTGSQKPIGFEGSDANENLLQAFEAASSGLQGVFIAFAGKIIHGCRAYKIHSRQPDAFVSRNYPYITAENQPEYPKKQPSLFPSFSEKVFLLKLVPGICGDVIGAFIEKGYQGIVIEGFGTGSIPSLDSDLLDAIEYATVTKNIPVVLISQCLYGGTDLDVYEVGTKAKKAGVISGFDMTAEAAVVKLMWVLGQTRDLEIVKKMMLENYCGEITY